MFDLQTQNIWDMPISSIIKGGNMLQKMWSFGYSEGRMLHCYDYLPAKVEPEYVKLAYSQMVGFPTCNIWIIVVLWTENRTRTDCRIASTQASKGHWPDPLYYTKQETGWLVQRSDFNYKLGYNNRKQDEGQYIAKKSKYTENNFGPDYLKVELQYRP